MEQAASAVVLGRLGCEGSERRATVAIKQRTAHGGCDTPRGPVSRSWKEEVPRSSEARPSHSSRRWSGTPSPRRKGSGWRRKPGWKRHLRGKQCTPPTRLAAENCPPAAPHRPRRGRQATNLPSLCKRVRVNACSRRGGSRKPPKPRTVVGELPALMRGIGKWVLTHQAMGGGDRTRRGNP